MREEKKLHPFGVECTYSELAIMLGRSKKAFTNECYLYGLERTLAKAQIGNARTLAARLEESKREMQEDVDTVMKDVFGVKVDVEPEAIQEPAQTDIPATMAEDAAADTEPQSASEVDKESDAEEYWRLQLRTLNALIKDIASAAELIGDLDQVLFKNMVGDLKDLRACQFLRYAEVDWEAVACSRR